MKFQGALLPLALISSVDAFSISKETIKAGVFDAIQDVQQFDLSKYNPFQQSQVTAEEDDIHYSTVNQSEWPIDLSGYENDIVIRLAMDPKTVMEREIMKNCNNCDVWSRSQTFMDIKLPRDELQPLLESSEIKVDEYSIIIDDLAQKIFESYPKNFFNAQDDDEIVALDDELFFKEYRPLKTIYSWFDLLAETYSGFVSVENFGTTFEGQKLKALYIDTSRFSEGNNPNNKTIIIAAGIHAREWISVTSANYIIFQLLTKYGISKPETDYLNQLNILVVPVFNPDGYTYSWTNDRLWRKNRQETYLPRCFGIDIDHSFDYRWEKTEETSWPCDEDYSGEVPKEALEVAQFEEFLNSSKANHQHLQLYGYIDLHSYAQEILYPYAYSCEHRPRDEENLLELAYGLSKAIRLNSGKNYLVTPACKDKNVDLTPGMGSGSSLDYLYSTAMAHWAFQIKLRDSGSHGFLLPSKFIKPVGEEVYEAVKYFFDFILDPEL
ncbi:putative metallocarboxypeptidase [Saccharomycopsis crataegensis]|uniref:Inactive metallocarboxypeptidase ECM14 n=1 Tax=Saccharomycopsis crataegensis TaxID=43959 RepID=A0AAV5QJX2_9ASCO|nr:putative metallocarboxypeptidase [Saccharomycopsis crataegensis]